MNHLSKHLLLSDGSLVDMEAEPWQVANGQPIGQDADPYSSSSMGRSTGLHVPRDRLEDCHVPGCQFGHHSRTHQDTGASSLF